MKGGRKEERRKYICTIDFPTLLQVSLSETKVSDASCFTACANLRRLDLSGTQVREGEGMREGGRREEEQRKKKVTHIYM